MVGARSKPAHPSPLALRRWPRTARLLRAVHFIRGIPRAPRDGMAASVSTRTATPAR